MVNIHDYYTLKYNIKRALESDEQLSKYDKD